MRIIQPEYARLFLKVPTVKDEELIDSTAQQGCFRLEGEWLKLLLFYDSHRIEFESAQLDWTWQE